MELTTDNDRTADEIALVAQAGVGDREAFRALYERYSGPLFSLAVHMVGDPNEAEDLLQETFVKLWRHARDYDPRLARPFSWAVLLLRRTCIDHLRKRQRAPLLLPLPEEEGFAGAAESPRASAISQEDVRRVREALTRVPVAQRAALELTLFSGLTQQEIATRLDQPLGTVKSWIRRGLLELRDTIKGGAAMNQEDQERACQYVLDQLTEADRAQFIARLKTDADLAEFVRGLELAAEARVGALPQRVPSPAVWARIESELAGRAPVAETARAAGRAEAIRPLASPFLFRRWAMLGGIAAAVAITLGGLVTRRLLEPAPVGVVVATLDQGTSTTRRLVLPEAEGAEPGARFVQLAALAEKLWHQAAPREQGNHGYALFDPASREGFIGVQQAPALRPGQQYRLWVVDERSGEARDAGVLPMREAKRGLYFFSLPQGSGVAGNVSFMVTVEPEQTAAAQPTGKVVLGQRF